MWTTGGMVEWLPSRPALVLRYGEWFGKWTTNTLVAWTSELHVVQPFRLTLSIKDFGQNKDNDASLCVCAHRQEGVDMGMYYQIGRAHV